MKKWPLGTAVRSLSNKAKRVEKENVVLADALNLLSPETKTYKPSLYSNLTKGSAHEQFKVDDMLNVSMPKSAHAHTTQTYINNLFFGLSSLHNKKSEVLHMNDRELHTYVKTIQSESKILETIQLLYYQQRLTPKLLIELTLNKHFNNLLKCCINLFDLKSQNLHWWSNPLSYIHYNIILLKKSHDLKQPLMIIKNLKDNFDAYYFPLAQAGRLSPFYERIIWKFYFEYTKQFNEVYYINKLSSVRSMFLIWESSMNSGEISRYILTNQHLNELQQIFFKVCSNAVIQRNINEELSLGPNSILLSNLKQISIKYKLYDLNDQPQDESLRLVYYSLVNSLENITSNQSKDLGEEDVASLTQLLLDLKAYKEIKLMNMYTDVVAENAVMVRA